MPTDSANHAKHRPMLRKVIKSVGLCAVAAIIFLFGVGIGNGRIVLGNTQEAANGKLPATLDYNSVQQVYQLLKTKYDGQLDASKLLSGMKSGLAAATGDPHTEYFDKNAAKDFENQLNGSFTGIGAELGQDDKGNLVIVAPIDGFPASRAGLRPQDMVVDINGTSTTGMTVDEAVNRIRGPKGTNVTLHIIREKTQDMTLTITRDDIKIPSVKWEMLDGSVGSIKVSQFSDDTSVLIKNAAYALRDQGAKSILLDLRGNPGGLLTAAVDMASMWLPRGTTILQEKRGNTVVQTYKSQVDQPPLQGKPTVVLVNAGSASAAEIVTGALHDNKAATVMGEKSYGKGSVQEIQNLPAGDEIKITVARWYRPNGQNIDKKGITPDQVVNMTDSDYKQGLDPQKDAALAFLRK